MQKASLGIKLEDMLLWRFRMGLSEGKWGMLQQSLRG